MIPLPVAINLSYWLYKVHPEVFAALLNTGKGRPSGLGALGDDGTDFFPGISVMPDTSSSFDVGNFVDSGAGSITTADINTSLSPDLVSLPAPALGSNDFYTGITPMPAADTAADIGNFLDNSNAPAAAAVQTSSPSTLTAPAASSIGAVASVLTAGLGALAAVTTAIYKSGTPQASTIGVQANRAVNGVNPAPVTYGYNSAGQLVPVISSPTTGTVGALSPQTLASLGIPSSWSPYILPALVGVIVLMAMGASKK